MTLLFILGISMVLLAIVLVGSALSSTTETGCHPVPGRPRGDDQRPEGADQGAGPLVRRPGPRAAASSGARARAGASGADSPDRIRHKLDLAGNPHGWTVDRVVSGKVIGAVVGLVARHRASA